MMGLMPPRTRRAAPRLSREEKKAMTRQRLLDAAAVVFARKGFAGASLDDVAEEAGLTKGAVYSNFGSKDDLIQALLEERLNRPYDQIADRVDRSGSQAEQARQANAMVMSTFERERDTHLLGIEFMAHLARNPHLTRRGSYRERVTAVAADMQAYADAENRTLPLPAYDLAVGLFALGQGIILERLVNPDDVPEDLFARMIMLIMRDSDQPGDRGKAKR
jgi:AcrR family transcriptional regulator